MLQSVLVIGGTGAQGSAVVRALAQTGRYQIKILTRSLQSAQAKALSELSQVSLLEGDCFSVPDLERAFAGIDSCFINTNGFAIGEKNEIFWSIRMYEIAHFAGVKHFVYGGLEYISRKAGFDPKYRCHHYDAKGKFGDFLASQPTSPMNWSVISSGPYMESLADSYRPQVNEEGTYIFNLPLGDGAMPLICLDDLGAYARWLFETPTKSAGLNLEIATVHASGEDIANAFTTATGKPAKYVAADLDKYMTEFWSMLPDGKDTKIGEPFAKGDPTLMTYGQNFTAWWNIYRSSGSNKGLITRDYKMLDEILPTRIRSVAEWMKKSKFTGERRALLKDLSERGI